MYNSKYEKEANEFCDAIRTLAASPKNLENLECYLSFHFDVWMKMYASDPQAITSEMLQFATMQI